MYTERERERERDVWAPTTFSPYGRSEARPECTIGKMMPKARVTRCEFPPMMSSRNATKSSL